MKRRNASAGFFYLPFSREAKRSLQDRFSLSLFWPHARGWKSNPDIWEPNSLGKSKARAEEATTQPSARPFLFLLSSRHSSIKFRLGGRTERRRRSVCCTQKVTPTAAAAAAAALICVQSSRPPSLPSPVSESNPTQTDKQRPAAGWMERQSA